jgi:hypothetical protein
MTGSSREFDKEEWSSLDQKHFKERRTRVKVSCVKENGKVRVVTVGPPEQAYSKPVAEALYNRLTKEKWLLRGEAKPTCFREFGRVDGEVFVSGDYESATDFMDIETTEYILGIILDNARVIPPEVRTYCIHSLRHVVVYPDGSTVRQSCGQLMGDYLSFPLLCLRNYLPFAFLTRSTSGKLPPCKINGDDIVFRSSMGVAVEWMDGVRRCGLKLSKGKTLISADTFSLNSSFFLARHGRLPDLCPVIRSKSLIFRESAPDGSAYAGFMRGWQRSGVEWERRQRKVGALWLRSARRAIDALGRGTWGLGVRAVPSVLHTAGLVAVETYFNPGGRREKITPPALPTVVIGSAWVKVPRSEVRGVPRKVLKEWDKAVAQTMHGESWGLLRDPTAGERVWKEAKETGVSGAVRNFLKLLKKPLRYGGRLCYYRGWNLPLGNMPCYKEKGVWVPRDREPQKVRVDFRCPERVQLMAALPDCTYT